ncbi:MAG: hypothetical protein KJZ72_21045 [Anaerolineales bacterium]|nr:hypothetical protein [Anaerolineales bacterium]
MMTKPASQISYHNYYTGARVYPYDWQLKLQKGSYFRIVTEYYPTVYGVILETLSEKGYFRVQAYSERIPYGHKAILCIVEPTRILTQQEFEEARTRHWNTVEGEVQ